MSTFEESSRRLAGKRPYSKTAVDTAGSRWRDGERYDPEPIEDFLEFNATFLSDLLEIAEETARSLILPLQLGREPKVLPGSNTYIISGRVKTESTLLQKLRRMGTTPISNIHDVAGLRFDSSLTLSEQIKVAEAFKNAFLVEGAKRVDIRDLREESHSGYRAIHLHIRSGLGRAEMQIRTALQSKWANLYEEAADIYGRDIRYLHEKGVSMPPGAEDVVGQLHELSSLVKRVEELSDTRNPNLQPRIDALQREVYGMLDDIHASTRVARPKRRP